MVRETQDGSLGEALGNLIGRAAVGAVAGALVLLALGLVAEALRRRHRARRVLALLDLTLPIGVRTAVVSLLALVATFTGPRPVGAADSVRGWLGQASASTTTTTRTPVATPGALEGRDAPPATVPTGPVVLIPPATVERLDPVPSTPAPVPVPPVAVPPVAVPPVAVPPVPIPPDAPTAKRPGYVVQRGDCLWSIAARLLGGRADARSIDAAWRQIYAANRAAIGDDPNLIHIGLTLELPPLVAQP